MINGVCALRDVELSFCAAGFASRERYVSESTSGDQSGNLVYFLA